MKKILIVISMIIMAGTCQKAGPDCHFYILIINNSSKAVIPALKFINTSNNCILSGSTLQTSEKYEFRLRECWEDELADGRSQEIYLVDPDHYNTPTIFYDCDSIESKNTILKHYSLTLDDLKNMDFTITYE